MAELNLPDTYRRAVSVIDEVGWGQRYYLGRNGCVCAMGAIIRALGGHIVGEGGEQLPDFGDNDVADTLFQEAELSLGWLVGPDRDVSSWNDEDGRTADQVKALLLKAAERAEQSDG